MPHMIALETLDFHGIVHPGDAIVTSNGCGEALSLLTKLVEQRGELKPLRMFLGAGFSALLQPEHADAIRFYGLGAMGARRSLAKAGVLEIMPTHLSAIGPSIRSGLIPCDVAFVQLPPPNSDGVYSWGLTSDYLRAAVDTARVVVAEMNEQIPWTVCEDPPAEQDLDFFVNVSYHPVEVPASPISGVDRAIAERILPFIPDRATLQSGIGAVPESVLSLVGGHRELGLHSGMLGDSAAILMEKGIVTNAFKEVAPGVTLTAALIGTQRLYDFARNNPCIRLCSSETTHGAAALAKLNRFVSINSAVEVDLTGQVNAEAIGGEYIGGVGGQVDYMRAAAQSKDGCAVIALPATSRDGKRSRIVFKLSGPVTTARSDVSIVVTEYGVADLRGQSLRERCKAMIGIAAPQFQEELARSNAAGSV